MHGLNIHVNQYSTEYMRRKQKQSVADGQTDDGQSDP